MIRHTVGGEVQIGQKVIRVGLLDIGSVKFESHEHDTGKDHNAHVNFANEGVLFSPCPSC
jgi:hypothetical protein